MTSDILQVLLIGSGGVGTIVAYGIDYVGRSNLSLVVRGDYENVSANGFNINSYDYGIVNGWKPKRIYPNVEAASEIEYDFVVIATKNIPDIIATEEMIEKVITPQKTTIMLMQNGFDLGRPIFKKYPQNVVLSGISFIGSHNFHGVITQTQHDKVVVSYFENPNLKREIQEEKAKQFVSIYSNEKNTCTYFNDDKWYRYRKLVYNATMNTICALTGVDTGRLEASGGYDSLAVPAMKEIIAIARADGIFLPSDVINTVCHSDEGDYFEPSMRVDVKKGNPLELETILGNVLKVARDLEVATPILDVIYKLLQVVQFRLKESNGYIVLPKERPHSSKFYQ